MQEWSSRSEFSADVSAKCRVKQDSFHRAGLGGNACSGLFFSAGWLCFRGTIVNQSNVNVHWPCPQPSRSRLTLALYWISPWVSPYVFQIMCSIRIWNVPSQDAVLICLFIYLCFFGGGTLFVNLKKKSTLIANGLFCVSACSGPATYG